MRRVLCALSFLAIILLPAFSYSQPLFHKFINDQFTNWVSGYTDNDEVLLISYDGFFTTFLKLDDNADTLWSKRFAQPAYVANALLVPATKKKMNHISYDSANIYLSQTDDFHFMWAKSYPYDTSLFNINLSELSFGKRFSNGTIAIVGNTIIPTGGGFGMDKAPIAALTDSMGNLLWSMKYYIPTRCFEPRFIADRGNDLVLVGSFYSIIAGQPPSTESVATMIINKTTGLTSGHVNVYGVNGDLVLQNISDEGNYITGYKFDPFAGDPGGIAMVSKIAPDGSFYWTKSVSCASHPAGNFCTVLKSKENDLVLGGIAMPLNPLGGTDDGQFFLMRADTGLNTIHWSMIYSDTTMTGDYLDIGTAYLCKQTSDNKLLSWGTFTYSNGMGYAIKADPADGMSACNNIPLNTTAGNITTIHNTYSVTATANVLASAQTITQIDDIPEPSMGTIVVSPVCVNYSGVTELSDQGHISICPNPATDMITIMAAGDLAGTAYRIIDETGRTALSGTFADNSNTIDIRSLAGGIYALLIEQINSRNLLLVIK